MHPSNADVFCTISSPARDPPQHGSAHWQPAPKRGGVCLRPRWCICTDTDTGSESPLLFALNLTPVASTAISHSLHLNQDGASRSSLPEARCDECSSLLTGCPGPSPCHTRPVNQSWRNGAEAMQQACHDQSTFANCRQHPSSPRPNHSKHHPFSACTSHAAGGPSQCDWLSVQVPTKRSQRLVFLVPHSCPALSQSSHPVLLAKAGFCNQVPSPIFWSRNKGPSSTRKGGHLELRRWERAA